MEKDWIELSKENRSWHFHEADLYWREPDEMFVTAREEITWKMIQKKCIYRLQYAHLLPQAGHSACLHTKSSPPLVWDPASGPISSHSGLNAINYLHCNTN